LVICPSNPFISIDPILAVPGVRAALRDCAAPIAAVSPIIGGQAVKGPTAKMMAELGLPVDATTVARHYRDFLDLYIADEEDAARHLAKNGAGGMLTLPGDIPLVTAAEIAQLLDAHRPAPAFTIAPSHDELGSNALIVSPPDAVSLRFGDNSFFPHLAAAEARGIRPTILPLPGIALDSDNPD